MNKFIGLGNLTRDPELRYTPKGTVVCNVSIALNRKWKGEDGKERESVCFVECVLWGRTAEATAQYCKKGKRVLIEGRLDQQSWEDKDTHKQRSKIVVQVETIQFIGSAAESSDSSRQRVPADSGRQDSPTAADPGPEDDDVPF